MTDINYAFNTLDNRTDMPCVDFSSVVGFAPASRIPVMPQRSDTYMSMDNNIRSVADDNSIPIINLGSQVPITGPNLNNFYVNETQRGEVYPTVVTQIGLKGHNEWNNLSYLDPVRNTNKEISSNVSYNGNAQRQDFGSTFWTYDDSAKNTMKSTTEFSYSNNPERQSAGTKFYTYEDLPRTTNSETSQFSFMGNIAPSIIRRDINRFQFTGLEGSDETVETPLLESFSDTVNEEKDNTVQQTLRQEGLVKVRSDPNLGPEKKYAAKGRAAGGYKTNGLRAATLAINWNSGPGRENIRLDPEAAMGKINFKGLNDFKLDGPGTFQQALPDGSRYQFANIMTAPKPSANKLIGLDDRQIASYQVTALKNNPLSIFTSNAAGEIPNLYAFNQPNTYTSMTPAPKAKIVKRLNNDRTQAQKNTDGGIGGLNPQNVYPPGNSVLNTNTKNPVMNIFGGVGFDKDPFTEYYNPMLEQGSSNFYRTAEFEGRSYSGTGPFVSNTSPGPNIVYGPTETFRPYERGGDVGIEQILTGPDGNQYVCEGNRALSYVTDDLIIDRDLY